MSNIGHDDIISAMTSNQHPVSWQIVPGGGKGSHTKLEWDPSDKKARRVVIVPRKDPIPTGTLRSISEQSGADSFKEWKAWIKRYR